MSWPPSAAGSGIAIANTNNGAARVQEPWPIPLPLEVESNGEIDAAVVGVRAAAPEGATTASRPATAEAGVHASRLAELVGSKNTLVSARVEVVQHIGEVRADGDTVTAIG